MFISRFVWKQTNFLLPLESFIRKTLLRYNAYYVVFFFRCTIFQKEITVKNHVNLKELLHKGLDPSLARKSNLYLGGNQSNLSKGFGISGFFAPPKKYTKELIFSCFCWHHKKANKQCSFPLEKVWRFLEEQNIRVLCSVANTKKGQHLFRLAFGLNIECRVATSEPVFDLFQLF